MAIAREHLSLRRSDLRKSQGLMPGDLAEGPPNPEATLTGTDGSIRLVPAVSQTNSVGLRSWLRNLPPPIRTPCRQVEVTKN
jgi:hypothetical protein